MPLSKIVSISNVPGLHHVVATRPNGLVVQALDSDSTKFISARIHMFTTLDNITIYTKQDSVELKTVFSSMFKNEEKIPPVSANESTEVLKDYFKKIVPEYDDEKVYMSDIKKVLKWYEALKQHKIIEKLIEAEAEDNKEENKKEKKDDKKSATKEKSKAVKPKKDKASPMPKPKPAPNTTKTQVKKTTNK